jgi:uncharacterized membrane protein
MATMARVGAGDQSFWRAMMLGIALFIVFGFAQFSARGFVNVGAVPAYVHFHGAIMIAWLALSVTQATLIQRDNLALHRKLGWLGAALAAGVVVTGSFVGIMAVQTGRQPPFFSPAYFLALTQFGMVCFAAIVTFAIARRRNTEWHRRLMVGAMIMLMEPALGRILPMPLIMPWGELLVLVIQLGVFGLMVRHDRRVHRRIHPATVAGMAFVVVGHLGVELLAIFPLFAALANGMTPA